MEINEIEAELIAAYEHSRCNREMLKKDNLCGCYYCLSLFHPSKIFSWGPDKQTAVCPYCLMHSIISESSGYPMTMDFLVRMHHAWFDVE